jgi:hypothetical protein
MLDVVETFQGAMSEMLLHDCKDSYYVIDEQYSGR